MPDRIIAPYGAWKSPITTDLIVAGGVRLGEPMTDGPDIYWVEGRPAEAGRSVIVRRLPDGRVEDVTPAPFNARTRVNEYGGGAYLAAGGTVYFSNFADGRLYRQDRGETPGPITPEGDWRYADMALDTHRGRLICVREDHTVSGQEPSTALVAIELTGRRTVQVLISGSDFYSSPRISPDGKRLAWLAWNHPAMPWTGTELWTGVLNEDGSVSQTALLAGGPHESVFQPEWSPDGELHFISDRSGWWNLYRRRGESLEPLAPMDAEFGVPQWVFGLSTYAFVDRDTIVCAFTQNGVWHLARIDRATLRFHEFSLPFTSISGVQAGEGCAVFIGGSPSESESVARCGLALGRPEVIRRSSSISPDPKYVSVPQSIEYPTEDGLMAYAFFYKPHNDDFEAPEGDRPPLIVISHGGPTSSASPTLSLSIQYWTSRGFAVLDVNYGGSAGYGRPYRERLNGRWGVVDVNDCSNGALYLTARGEADAGRTIIRGGSAGGYTTLAALTFRNTFKAGASYYGVSDLELLARDTHKFESHYLESLVGPYPDQRELYRERSPVHFTDRLSCPIIFFQGLDDKVVPPNQAESMIDAMSRKGLPVAYVSFEGEGHGFRKAGNIKRALEAELYFYSKMFRFTPADPIEPVRIDNDPLC